MKLNMNNPQLAQWRWSEQEWLFIIDQNPCAIHHFNFILFGKITASKKLLKLTNTKKTNYRWLKRMRFPIIRFSATDVKKNFYKEHSNLKKSHAIFVINDRHWFELT